MIGRHSIGEIELSSIIKSTSPRSSHLNFLLGGYFLHSLSASASPGRSGSAGGAGGAGVAGGAGKGVAGAGGATVRVPVGGPLFCCAHSGDVAKRRPATSALRVGRIKRVLIRVG